MPAKAASISAMSCGRRTLRGQTHPGRLDHHAQFVQVAQEVAGQTRRCDCQATRSGSNQFQSCAGCTRVPTFGPVREQALGDQRLHRLAHHRAADTELLAEQRLGRQRAAPAGSARRRSPRRAGRACCRGTFLICTVLASPARRRPYASFKRTPRNRLCRAAGGAPSGVSVDVRVCLRRPNASRTVRALRGRGVRPPGRFGGIHLSRARTASPEAGRRLGGSSGRAAWRRKSRRRATHRPNRNAHPARRRASCRPADRSPCARAG